MKNKSLQKTTTPTSNNDQKNDSLINKVRILIRKQKYLNSPSQKNKHVAIDGKELSEKLEHFTTLAEENVEQYISARFSGEDFKIKPIPVTKEEELEQNNVMNLTKEEITRKIFEAFDLMADGDASLQEEIFHKKIKNFSKTNYIDFYYNLLEIIESYKFEDTNEDIENQVL